MGERSCFVCGAGKDDPRYPLVALCRRCYDKVASYTAEGQDPKSPVYDLSLRGAIAHVARLWVTQSNAPQNDLERQDMEERLALIEQFRTASGG